MVRVGSTMAGIYYVDNVRLNPGMNELSKRDLHVLLNDPWFVRKMSDGSFKVEEMPPVVVDGIEDLTVAEAEPIIESSDDVALLRTYLTDPRVTIQRLARKRLDELSEASSDEDDGGRR